MKLVEILRLGVDYHASDLHLVPCLSPIVRVDGDLIQLKDIPPLIPEELKDIIYEALTPEQQLNFESELEFDMAFSIQELGNFRVNVMHQLHGIAAFFRYIPANVPTFESLDLPVVLKSLLVLQHGLILITGPTGSGKSTTQAAMIDYINSIRACNIVTIEDPIEFVYQNKKSIIHQRQVHKDTHHVATALRSALRQDPDIIVLGELRDLETINLALTAAETGHLVMATLHASSAPLAINRIVDVFNTEEKNRVRNLLSETLQAVICQTLVKKIEGGRTGAFEIMLATPAIRQLIRSDKIAHMVMTMQTSGDLGMCTMDQFLQTLVSRKMITAAVARSVTANQEWFANLI
jgi:twitching motility protein PilT